MGSALKTKPPGAQWTQRTPESIEAVRASIGRSPQRSARKHAAALNLNRTTVCRILHRDSKFHPYKIQVVQELKPPDYVARQQFCEKMIEKINDDPNFVNNFFMSDEFHFPLLLYCISIRKSISREKCGILPKGPKYLRKYVCSSVAIARQWVHDSYPWKLTMRSCW
jgi:hypothetical protein